MNYIFDQKNYNPLYSSIKNNRLSSRINNNNIKNSINNSIYIPEIPNQNKTMDFKNLKINFNKNLTTGKKNKDNKFDFQKKFIKKANKNIFKNTYVSNNNLKISENFLGDFKNKITIQDEDSENLSKLAEDLLSMSNKNEEEDIVKPRGPINKNDFLGKSITFYNINEEFKINNEAPFDKNKQYEYMKEVPKIKIQSYVSPFQKLNINRNNINPIIMDSNLKSKNMKNIINNPSNFKNVSQNLNINAKNTYYSRLENKLENSENNNNYYILQNENQYQTNGNNINNLGEYYYKTVNTARLSNYYKNTSKNKSNSQKNNSYKNNNKLSNNKLINQNNNELYIPKFPHYNIEGNEYSKTENKSGYNSKRLVPPSPRNIISQKKVTSLYKNHNNEIVHNYENINLSSRKNIRDNYFSEIKINSQKIGNKLSQKANINLNLNVKKNNYFQSSENINFNGSNSLKKLNSNINNAESFNNILDNKYKDRYENNDPRQRNASQNVYKYLNERKILFKSNNQKQLLMI